MAINLLDFLPDSDSIYLSKQELFYAELCSLTCSPRHDWQFTDENDRYLGFYYSDVYADVFSSISHIVDAVPEWFPAYCSTKRKKIQLTPEEMNIAAMRRMATHHKQQIHCVALAISYGLTERECILVADERNMELSECILDELFCGKSYDQVLAILQMGEKSIEERVKRLNAPYDCEVELRFSDGKTVTGVQKRGEWLIDTENGKRYKVAPV